MWLRAIASGVLLACTVVRAAPPIRSVEAPKVGGTFTLTDANGRRFASTNLAGKPYVLFFGYTFCPDICPTTLIQLAHLRHALGPQGNAFTIVFVTVDPARDTPAVLRRYAAAFNTPIVALTGSEAEIDSVTRAFHVFVRRTQQRGGPDLIEHSSTPYLIGKDGAYRALLSGEEASDVALLRAAIRA